MPFLGKWTHIFFRSRLVRNDKYMKKHLHNLPLWLHWPPQFMSANLAFSFSRPSLEQGSSALVLWTFVSGDSSLLGDLHPLDARSSPLPVTIKNFFWHCQMSHWGHDHPWSKTIAAGWKGFPRWSLLTCFPKWIASFHSQKCHNLDKGLNGHPTCLSK